MLVDSKTFLRNTLIEKLSNLNSALAKLNLSTALFTFEDRTILERNISELKASLQLIEQSRLKASLQLIEESHDLDLSYTESRKEGDVSN